MAAVLNDLTNELDVAEWSCEEAFRFHVAIVREDDGSVSVISLNLPGVVSCGESEAEAIEHFRDAAREVIASYESDGVEIPWKVCVDSDIPLGAQQRWIIL